MESTTQDTAQPSAERPKLAYFATDKGITYFIGGAPKFIPASHNEFEKAKAALKARDFEALDLILNPQKKFEKVVLPRLLGMAQDFEIVDGHIVRFGQYSFTPELSAKVIRMVEQDYDVEPVLAFLRKVRENPSATAQRELFLFCAANDFLIHEDGDILAYKSVNEDYTDSHTGQVINKPAHLMTEEERAALPTTTERNVTTSIEDGFTVVSTPREEVDDNRQQTCSFGLHFAAHQYAVNFGGGTSRIIVQKIHPKDVVSIPYDYNNQKGRCSRYEILAEIAHPRVRERGLRDEVYNTDAVQGESLNGPEPEPENLRERFLRAVRQITGTSREDFGMENDLDDLGVARYEFGAVMDRVNEEFEVEIDWTGFGTYDHLSVLYDKVESEVGSDDVPGDEEEGEEEKLAYIPEEEVEAIVATLQHQLARREIRDEGDFDTALEEAGYDPESATVKQQLRDAGFGAWIDG